MRSYSIKLTISLILFFLFVLIKPSTIYAWAAVYGRVTYTTPEGTVIGITNVIINHCWTKEGKSQCVSTITDSGGNFGIDGIDCAGTDMGLAVVGWAGAAGIPPGGVFVPSDYSLNGINNGVSYEKPFYYVIPMSPTPTPTPTITPTPTPTITPTPTPCWNPGALSQSLAPTATPGPSPIPKPTPTWGYMRVKIGNL